MRQHGVILALCLSLLGCGSIGYRVVSTDHAVRLGASVALSPISHAGGTGDPEGFDASLARALEDTTPDHRVEADARYTIHVDVRELRREGERTIASSAVSIRDGRGQTVDELDVSFEVRADEAEAGAELGRRIGHFVTHREDHRI